MTDKLVEIPEDVQKCPFCGEELSYAQEIDGGFEILTCDCPHGIWFFGNDKMWNFLDWLIVQADKAERLQKAVDYALQVLDNVSEIGGIDLEIIKIKQLIKGE